MSDSTSGFGSHGEPGGSRDDDPDPGEPGAQGGTGGSAADAVPGGAGRQDRFRRLVERMEGVVFYEHGPDHRFTYLSPSAREVYGYSAEELVGRPYEVLHPGDPSDATVHELTQLAFRERQATGGYTAVNQRKDGRIIFVEIIETPVVEDGEVVAVQGVARDVTDRVRAQRALRESEQRLREVHKMEAVGRLAGGIAHEFNNLLTTITGHVELLLEDSPDGERRGGLEEIRRAADRAGTLTRQILDFGRNHVSHPRALHLNDLLVELDGLLERLLGDRVVLEKALEPDPPAVRVDPERVEQLVVDLALNARDAMPEGGTLTLETRSVSFSSAYRPADLLPGRYVALAVRDTGTGIPPEVLDQVFEPFFTTKEPGEGTGLGLSTIYGIAKLAAGGVEVESEPGKGTTVRVYFPAVEEMAPHETAEPAGRLLARPYAEERGTILVVDHDPESRRFLERVLEAGGHRVTGVADTDEALPVAESRGPELDLLVARATQAGLTLARTLQARLDGLRLLLMASQGEQDVAVEHVLQQGVPVLPTPVIPGEVLRRVDELMASGRPGA